MVKKVDIYGKQAKKVTSNFRTSGCRACITPIDCRKPRNQNSVLAAGQIDTRGDRDGASPASSRAWTISATPTTLRPSIAR
jgi:hypothetical protein